MIRFALGLASGALTGALVLGILSYARGQEAPTPQCYGIHATAAHTIKQNPGAQAGFVEGKAAEELFTAIVNRLGPPPFTFVPSHIFVLVRENAVLVMFAKDGCTGPDLTFLISYVIWADILRDVGGHDI